MVVRWPQEEEDYLIPDLENVIGPGDVLRVFKARSEQGKVRHFCFTKLGEPQLFLPLIEDGSSTYFRPVTIYAIPVPAILGRRDLLLWITDSP